jgi:hypothetical protein
MAQVQQQQPVGGAGGPPLPPVDECLQIWRQLREKLGEFSILDSEQVTAEKRVQAQNLYHRYNQCMDEKRPGLLRGSLRAGELEMIFPPEAQQNQQQNQQQNPQGGAGRRIKKSMRKQRRRRNTRRRLNRRR